MELEIYQVDAFTKRVFTGNYAAVILLPAWLDDVVLQNIASENNLSETAFLVKRLDGSFHIRWFSPLSEIAFCGHASLAAAFVLFLIKKEVLTESLSFCADDLGVFKLKLLANHHITLNLPNRKPMPCDAPKALLQAFEYTPVTILKNRQAYFLIFEDEEQVINSIPDLNKIKMLAPLDVVISAPSKEDNVDFVSRYFWPANGGDEDPVTGSIHTGLAPYWAEKMQKNKLFAKQLSKRQGELQCSVSGSEVCVSGQAVLYMKGTIYI